MRATTLAFPLILAALALLGLSTTEALAGDPNRPNVDEVILHADPYFGAGAAYRFRILPEMRQRGVYLQGHLLDRNFRSVQVGRDVVASVYQAYPGRPGTGFDGRQLLDSTTGLDPRYSILIINRKSDGRKENGYRDLPFRVTVEAQWSAFLSGGQLHREEYFVAQSAKHPRVHDLSSVLLPGDQGADHIYLHTGRFPAKSVEVVLYDQPHAGGSNTRTFPTAPAYATTYNLWDYGFGDKTRSLGITWKGSEFKIPGVPVPPVPPQFVVPDVKGFWQNQLGLAYEVGTNGKHFAWKFPFVNETGQGVFKNPTDIEVRWTAANGSKHGPVTGKVERDASWRATRITFGNGLILTRAKASSKPPQAPVNLTGSWSSKYGKVDLQQQGANLKGVLHYPNGGTASLKGTIQGQNVNVTWFANPLAHGHGTFTMSPDGKRLAGPFTDVVSKGHDQWVLTR